jgi:Tfp pilus assembly protein PilF
MNNLGIVYWNQHNLDEAAQHFRKALAGREAQLGPKHTATLACVNNLGVVLRDQKDYSQAEKSLQRSLIGHRKASGQKHIPTFFDSKQSSNASFAFFRQIQVPHRYNLYTKVLIFVVQL